MGMVFYMPYPLLCLSILYIVFVNQYIIKNINKVLTLSIYSIILSTICNSNSSKIFLIQNFNSDLNFFIIL